MDGRDVRVLIKSICEIAGSQTLIDDARAALASVGVIEAIQNHDDWTIFNWLLELMQFQGVSDASARAFIEKHGLVTAGEIAHEQSRSPRCPKLQSYNHFESCGYQKWKQTCNRPEFFQSCPLPHHILRNGMLNQMAYSLFLFFRDVCGGDFVDWIDRQINKGQSTTRLADPLIDVLAHIQGVGPKIASLAMTTILLGGDAERKDWLKAGASMVVIDSLVHAWLHRTGVLKALEAEHLYGASCYGPKGCALLLYKLARLVDARRYNESYPKFFPRFVQYAIWTFCSADGLNICNGNQIDDHRRCRRRDCDLYQLCGRQRLHPLKPQTAL